MERKRNTRTEHQAWREREQAKWRKDQVSVFSPGTTLLLCALMVAPGLAIWRLAVALDWRLVLGAWVVVMAVTFCLYWHDKQQAKRGGWRTPESTLHFAGFLGGWPAAYVAQRAFRHKTAKTPFLVTFWLIVVPHQAVAIDFLSDWYWSHWIVVTLTR